MKVALNTINELFQAYVVKKEDDKNDDKKDEEDDESEDKSKLWALFLLSNIYLDMIAMSLCSSKV